MNCMLQIRLTLLLTISAVLIFLSTALALVAGSSIGKVVFLKNNEINVAKGDGADVKALTSDSVRKSKPVWSPDGQRIAYLIPGMESSNPKTHANIVIIHSTGIPQIVVPVLSTEADGTIVEGMRFVEEFGWFGNGAVFAMGTLNPRIAEYRVLDIDSSNVIQSYFGYGFATCAIGAKVAYLAENAGVDSRGVHVELQGVLVYSAPEGATLRGLQWSSKCQRLAFFQIGSANTRLVVLRFVDHSVRVEASLPLPKEMSNPEVKPVENSFLVSSDRVNLAYDGASRSLRPALENLEELQKQQQSRDLLIQNLGGSSPDWWMPRQE